MALNPTASCGILLALCLILSIITTKTQGQMIQVKQRYSRLLQRQAQTPTIYVIQPEQDKQGKPGAPASTAASSNWNNQKLVARQFDQQVSNARSAKQIFLTNEPAMLHNDQKLIEEQLPLEDSMIAHDYTWNSIVNNDQMGERAPITAVHHPAFTGGIKGRRAGTNSRREGSTKRRGFPAPPATKGHRSPSNGRKQAPVPAFSPGVDQFTDNNATASGEGRRRLAPGKKKNLVCYYGTWAVYRPDAGKFPVENIDPFLCTHIIYGFTGLSYDNLIKPLDPWNDLEDNYGKGAMKRFTNLKRTNPDLKTLVAIGGWNEGSVKYSKMASDPDARQRFVKSVVSFLDKYNFDGLDLDWEYPASRGGASYDKQNFVRLLRELHEAFAPRNYLLTAAVSAGKWFIDPAYDIPQVGKYLDLINLMAYDYHGGWESKTGHNAPLFSSPKHDRGKDENLLNVNWSVNYWLQQGAPAEKIMLGVGSYGRSFTLDKASENGISAPASQKGQAGPYTREPGSLGYNEICEAFQRQPHSWKVVRDPDYLAPYAYNERQWVGYDDMESLALKAQFAKSMGLGGMMLWSIETDDFLGRCHNEKYPLLNTIKRVMNGDQQPDLVRPPRPPTDQPPPSSTRRPSAVTAAPPASTTRRPVTPTTPGHEIEDDVPPSSSTTTRRPTTKRPNSVSPSTSRPRPPPPEPQPPVAPVSSTTTSTTRRPTVVTTPLATAMDECRGDGMFADPRNCRKFIRCVSSGGYQRFTIYRFDCAPGTAFNDAAGYCDHIYNVPSCANNSPARQLTSLSNQQVDWAFSQQQPNHHHQPQLLLPQRPTSWHYSYVL